MIPLRLKLQNYCQHRERDLDFTNGRVIVITAPNGYGKSNIFYALKNALTGAMTPGANKLEDDINDQASSFINDLQFELNNGSQARIIRTVQRKGANSVYLEITGSDGTKEKIIKSNEAVAKFEKLLGVPPKNACEVVIAEQRSIEALLFAPTGQCLKKLETFLHGDTFTAPIKVLETERELLFIDELAAERKESLEQSLKDTVYQIQCLQTLQKRHTATLGGPKTVALELKNQQVSQHQTIRAEHVTLSTELATLQESSSRLTANLAVLPGNLGALIQQTEAAHGTLASAWEQYNAGLRVQQAIRTTQQQLDTAKQQEQVAVQALTGWEAEAKRRSEASQALQYLGCQRDIAEQAGKLAVLTPLIGQLQQQESQQAQLKAVLTTTCHGYSGPLATMREAHKLLCSAQRQGAVAQCPVCQGSLKAEQLDILNANITRLAAELVKPSQALVALERQMAETTANRTASQKELSLRTEQKQRLDAAFKLAVLPASMEGLDTSSLQAILKTAQEPSAKVTLAVTNTRSTVARLSGQLQSLQAQLPESLVAPTQPESQVAVLKDKLDTYRQQERDSVSQTATLQAQTKQVKALQVKLGLLATKAKEAGLPSPEQDYLLSQEEIDALAQLASVRKELSTIETSLAAQAALHKQLEKQVADTDACIRGAKDTKEYAAHLNNMVGYFKTLPQVIMKSQLIKLCQSMDEIIREFHFFQPFKLSINDSLDFVLEYPNKLTRPIGKASGGERIILGIAFRLAAHRTLAPEIPWLAIDEPTNHLADENIAVMADVIRHLSANLSRYNLKKLFISTHSPVIAAQADLRITL